MLRQTKVLLDRAVALESAGHWQSVIAVCEEAYRRSIDERDVYHLTEAALRAGNSYLRCGDEENATEHLGLVVEVAGLNGFHSFAARALNSIAILHQEHGEIPEAEAVYERARSHASLGKDAVITGSIDQNLGALANIRGDLNRALTHYESALQCYREIGYDRGISGVLNNLGMLHIDLLQLDDATRCLQDALEVCRRNGDVTTEAIVHINRTELFIAKKNLELARTSCDEAFELTSRIGDNSCKSEALKFFGIIYRESDKPHLAEIHLRQAIEIAEAFTYPLQEAEAQRELSLVLRTQERNREALAALNRCHLLFSQLRASRDQTEVTSRISQLEEDFLSLVRGWGDSIEAKDRYTRGHCQRVAQYACRIAEEAGMEAGDMIWFRMGAFLHDIGKVEVPESILNKPGKLTDAERLTMERHTVAGDEMLSTIQFPWDIRPMVRSHHERWDGGGYPDQLRGEEIPYTARILRLADIFDALTTTRSYRRPLSPEEAFHIMEEDKASFDPYLFRIFEKLFPELREMSGEIRQLQHAEI